MFIVAGRGRRPSHWIICSFGTSSLNWQRCWPWLGNNYHGDWVKAARDAQKQIAVLLHLESIFEQQTTLVLHVSKEALLTNRITFVHQNSSSFVAFLALVFYLMYALLFLMLDFLTLAIPTVLLLALLSLANRFNFLLYFGVLVLITSTREFIIILHWLL